MNPADPITNYKLFNFSTNQSWNLYYNNLFPSPAHDRLEKIKRKWYQKNIDQNLNVDFEEAQQTNTANSNTTFNENPGSSPSNDSQPNRSGPAPPMQHPYIYKVEGFLKIIYFLLIPLLIPLNLGFYQRGLAGVICILALYRSYGLIKFRKEYLQQIVGSEFLSNIFYLLALWISPSQDGLLFCLPISAHFLSGVGEFLIRENSFLLKIGSIKAFFNKLKEVRNILIIAKSKMEIALFLVIILLLVLKLSSLFQLIVYFQFLSLKFKFNQNMQIAHSEIRYWLSQPGGGLAVLKPILLQFLDLVTKLMNYI